MKFSSNGDVDLGKLTCIKWYWSRPERDYVMFPSGIVARVDPGEFTGH